MRALKPAISSPRRSLADRHYLAVVAAEIHRLRRQLRTADDAARRRAPAQGRSSRTGRPGTPVARGAS